MIRFFVLFLLLLALLFGLELTPWAQRWFVEPWTTALARISTSLVTLFDSGVQATGKVIASHVERLRGIDRGRLQRRRGDDRAARRDSRVSRRRGSTSSSALAVGIVAVQGLNVVRVISLFYLGQWDRDVFEWAHLYVWQALIMLDVLIVWLVWVRTLPPARTRCRRRPSAGERIRGGVKRSPGRSPLARFVLAVLAWLPVTFAVWYFAAPVILWPATLLTELVARVGFGDLVSARRAERRASSPSRRRSSPGRRSRAASSPSTSTCCSTRSACRCSPR